MFLHDFEIYSTQFNHFNLISFGNRYCCNHINLFIFQITFYLHDSVIERPFTGIYHSILGSSRGIWSQTDTATTSWDSCSTFWRTTYDWICKICLQTVSITFSARAQPTSLRRKLSLSRSNSTLGNYHRSFDWSVCSHLVLMIVSKEAQADRRSLCCMGRCLVPRGSGRHCFLFYEWHFPLHPVN